jgi:hypothetical protein
LLRFGIVSARTSDMSLRLPSSMPLLQTTTRVSEETTPAIRLETARKCFEGGTSSTSSTPLITLDGSEDASMVGASEMSPR